MKSLFRLFFPLGLLVTLPLTAMASETLTIEMHEATESGPGKELGTVVVSKSPYGLVFTPFLKGLVPGLHGFHVHEKADCSPTTANGKTEPAGAAGGHLDPNGTGLHGAPWDDKTHQGDLPALYVNESGFASYPVLAPKFKTLSELQGHSLMIHVGADNYSDSPLKAGGGGARMACGIIK